MTASSISAELKALLLGPPGLSLAAAESLTCGRVQARIGEVPGASEYFRGGITAYTLDQKVRHLGVDRAHARKVDCVSPEVAAQMARGVCKLFQSDLGVATTGYASSVPGGGHPYAYWALTQVRRSRVIALRGGRIECPGASRIEAQTIVADAVLTELAGYLRELRGK
ncbi:MAG TPA: nicotinamide-nucleotide amidohydrolase family protein [Opitutaceae bacterium]